MAERWTLRLPVMAEHSFPISLREVLVDQTQDTNTDQPVPIDAAKTYDGGWSPISIMRGRSRNHILFFSSPEASVESHSCIVAISHCEKSCWHSISVRLGELALGHGTLIAIEDRLYSSEMTSLGTLPILQDFVGGLVFDPLQDVLYAADKKLDAIGVFSTP